MSSEPDNRAQLAALRLAYRTRRYLLRNPDVLGFGVGYRFRDGVRTDEPALIVYVRSGVKSRDPGQVARHRRIPMRVHVPGPGRERWLPVDLVETGVGELCLGVSPAVTVCPCDDGTSFGTVGWVARQADGTPAFCSCYHVLLPSFFSPAKQTQIFFDDPADPQFVTCPSPSFGGNLATQLGRVMRGERSPTADLALAEVLPGVALSGTMPGIGKLGKPRKLKSLKNEPGSGEFVQVAVGHDGPVEGRLVEFPVTFTVDYPDFSNYTLRNLIMAETEPLVRRGDSGALLLDKDRCPLGMLIGRDPSTKRSFYMPMAAIMALNLSPL